MSLGTDSFGAPTNSTSDRHIVVSSGNGDVSADYAPEPTTGALLT